MKSAIVAAIVFAIFIALVEWRRHNAASAIPKRFDAKVARAATAREARSEKPAAGRGAGRSSLVTRQADDAHGSAEGDRGQPDGGSAASPPSAEEVAEQRRKAEAVMAAIRRLLDKESRDEAWASSLETWIAAKARTMAGTRLDVVECRATLCSVAAIHADEAVYATWISRFPAPERNLRMVTLPAAITGGKMRTESFLIQEGSSLPARAR